MVIFDAFSGVMIITEPNQLRLRNQAKKKLANQS